MMRLQMLVFTLLVLVILGSCANTNTSEKLNEISIDLSNIEEVPFFDLFSKIELVPLETNEQSQIGGVRKVVVHNGAYYIEDKMQNCVLVFDEAGSFLNSIGKIGRGPGEYLSLNDFNINQFSNNVELLSIIPGRIIAYDTAGNFIETLDLPIEIRAPQAFCIISPDDIIITSLFDESRIYYYSKSKDKIYDRQRQNPDFNFRSIGKAKDLSPFSESETGIVFSEMFSNDVYSYLDKRIEYKYSWDFGQYNFEFSTIPKGKDRNYYHKYLRDITQNHVFNFMYNIENTRFILTSFAFKGIIHSLVYSKKDQTYSVFSEFQEGGYLVGPVSFFDDGVFSVITAAYLIEAIPSVSLNSENKQLLEDLKIGDNPIIVKYYFK
jgi:6-bladed beta-propeller